MKKIICFLLFPVLIFSQEIESLKLNKSLKDKKGVVNSLTIEDVRNVKEIGSITYKNKKVEFQFPQNDIKSVLELQFQKDNTSKGTNDILILLEKLQVSDQPWGKFTVGKFNIKLASFIKRGDNFYFINRLDEIYTTIPGDKGNIVNEISEEIAHKIITFIKASYNAPVSGVAIPNTEIMNYDALLKNQIKGLHTQQLLDGIYLNHYSFFNQQPTLGFEIKKNKKGQIVNATNNESMVFPQEIYIYVENGKPFKSTPIGFIEMQKDEKGFYINATKNELNSKNNNSGMIIGVISGGIVGAAIGAAIDSRSGSSNKRVTNINERPRVNIDPLTGAYVFEK